MKSSVSIWINIAIDLSLTLITLRVARWLREVVPLGVFLDEPLNFSLWLYLIVPVIWLIVFIALGVYNPTRVLRYSLHQELPRAWGAVIAAGLIFAGVAYLLFRELSRFLFFYFIILDLFCLSSWRWLLTRWPGLRQRLSGLSRRRVVVVGTGEIARQLGRAIIKPDSGLMLVGFVAEIPSTTPHSLTQAPVLGTIADLPHLIRQHQPDEVVYALPPEQQTLVRQSVVTLQDVMVNLRLVPNVFDLVFLRASVEIFEDIPLIGLREPAIQGFDRLIKRLFDVTMSTVLVILFTPIMLLIALLIKLDSPGSIFFKQQRVGEGGRLFWMYKFRSMVAGADTEEAQLLRQTDDGLLTFRKTPEDARITQVGRLLRRTSLDELPQLFNVIRGEMSLVGPRPELPGIVEKYEPWQRKRFAVPQGMTGWWQVNGRMERADPHERVEDDLFYIKNYSIWLDLRILWKTVHAVIVGEGAY